MLALVIKDTKVLVKSEEYITYKRRVKKIFATLMLALHGNNDT
jgi:hypothetical protein